MAVVAETKKTDNFDMFNNNLREDEISEHGYVGPFLKVSILGYPKTLFACKID